MIRITLLWFFIAAVAYCAVKDWFKALLGGILLMSVIEHPDMPKSILGIQGLNPWNVLLMVIVVAWLNSRRKEGLAWDMPLGVNRLLFIYCLIMFIAFVRMLGNSSGMSDYARLTGQDAVSTSSLISEYFINTFKWMIPGFLLFDGCRSKSRFNMALISVLAVYLLLGVQVIKWMPLSAATSGEALTERSLKILSNEVGYHRVNLSMMLAGASWAFFAARPLAPNRFGRLMCLLCSVIVFFGMALTGGRTGYATWGVVGAILGILRWRKLLLAMPVLAIMALIAVPAARERLLQGFSEDSIDTNSRIEGTALAGGGGTSWYTVLSGRNIAWPYVIDRIKERPWVGFGREAMQRTGIASFLYESWGELFPHPHNAYLQWSLDNGLVGLLFVAWFYGAILKKSALLFRDRDDPTSIAIGGVALSLIVALLGASIGSQTFYPREGAVGMWCAIFLMLRISIQRLDPVPFAAASEDH